MSIYCQRPLNLHWDETRKEKKRIYNSHDINWLKLKNITGMLKGPPCGKCDNCIIIKKAQKVSRIQFEAEHYEGQNTFVSLTLDDFNITSDHSICRKTFTETLDNMRRQIKYHNIDYKLQYFGVGEYGEKTERPHFHIIMFGRYPMEAKELIERVWKKGFIDVKPLDSGLSRYIAGYVTKKMTNIKNKDVQKWLNGRQPEFISQSTKPFMGKRQIDHMATEYIKDPNCTVGNDIPGFASQIKGKISYKNLDPFIRQYARKQFGIKDEQVKANQIEHRLKENFTMERIFRENSMRGISIQDLKLEMYKEHRKEFEIKREHYDKKRRPRPL